MSAPLPLCRELFSRLAREQLRVCHWKSNEHLEAALAGRTDLDLLLAPRDRERLHALLRELDFKEVLSPSEKRFPGMEDFLGCDRESGQLVHLHVHYRLILGEPFVKNFELPLVDLFLERVRERAGVPIPTAELELLLLAVRAPLKLRPLRLLLRWRRSGSKTLPSALVREFQWLQKDCDEHVFRELVRESGLPLSGKRLASFVQQIWDGSIRTPELYAMRRTVKRALRSYRRMHPVLAFPRDLRGRFYRTAFSQRIFLPRQKTLPHGGLILALVGADGSGKSALAKDLREWLDWKLLTEPVYLGLPREHWQYRGIERLRRLLKNLRRRVRNPDLRARFERWDERLRIERCLSAVRVRLRAGRRAQRVAGRGGIAVCDRYPLPALRAMAQPMDGPRIRAQFGTSWERLAAREEALYDRIVEPSHCFILRADFEVLRARKANLGEAVHRAKVEAVNALPASEYVSLIDASRPYSEVLLDLKQRAWELC